MNVAVCEHVKRPSNGKLKLATPVGKLRKFDKLVPLDVKLVSNNKKKLQHGRLFSAVAITYNSETEEKKRRHRKRWRKRKACTKPSLSAHSSVLFCLFLVSLWDETS